MTSCKRLDGALHLLDVVKWPFGGAAAATAPEAISKCLILPLTFSMPPSRWNIWHTAITEVFSSDMYDCTSQERCPPPQHTHTPTHLSSTAEIYDRLSFLTDAEWHIRTNRLYLSCSTTNGQNIILFRFNVLVNNAACKNYPNSLKRRLKYIYHLIIFVEFNMAKSLWISKKIFAHLARRSWDERCELDSSWKFALHHPQFFCWIVCVCFFFSAIHKCI